MHWRGGDEKQRRKKIEDKDAEEDEWGRGGRELINWLKDTHILFSVTLSGGPGGIMWRWGGRLQGLERSDTGAAFPNQGIALIRLQRR